MNSAIKLIYILMMSYMEGVKLDIFSNCLFFTEETQESSFISFLSNCLSLSICNNVSAVVTSRSVAI